MSVNTPYATLSFPQLFTAKPRFEGQPAVYSCNLVFDPKQQKSQAYKDLQAACVAVARKEWGDNVDLKKVHMPFRDAGEKTYDGYHAGHIFIAPWSKNKPGIVDRNREEILTPEEVWAGQLVRANVQPFAWNQPNKRGVSIGLNHIQIIQSNDRQRLDGRPSAGSAFDDGAVSEGENTPF